MTEECRQQIISNDYTDFLIDYDFNIENIKKFGTDCYNIVNSKYAVIHLPASRLSKNTINEFGYYALPICYGLLQTSSLEASGISRIQNLPSFSLRGQGVIIGIIDTGLQYTNSLFKNADNTTRIISIWDQTIETGKYPEGYYYGTEYTRDQINEALRSENPLNVVPSTDLNGHGTAITSIAGGSIDEKNNFRGIATNAEFVIVKLKEAKQNIKDFFMLPNDQVCYQNTDIMFGVKYLNETAKRLGRPIAMCIALGSNSGGHDGRDNLSEYISDVAEQTGTIITIGAGNEGNRGHHYYGVVDKTIGYDTFDLNVGENESGFTMELWGYTPNTYSIDFLSPTGEYIPRIPARMGESREIRFLFEKAVVYLDYRIVEAKTGDELIIIRFQNPTPGIWQFKVYATGETTLAYHVWLPIHNFIKESTYFVSANPDTTITAPGNTFAPLTVTAYDHVTGSLYLNASRGFTRVYIISPGLAAPGVGITVPQLDGTYGKSSGTSLSAAHATGIAAMLLEWAITKGNYPPMNSIEAKKFLYRGAKRDLNLTYPNREWGYGKIDIYKTFENLRGEQ